MLSDKRLFVLTDRDRIRSSRSYLSASSKADFDERAGPGQRPHKPCSFLYKLFHGTTPSDMAELIARSWPALRRN
jgi:hypothetical protein